MELIAPSHWKCIDCISDIHLDETDLPTFEALRRYLLSTDADAVFILGDLFEVWVGDDAISQGSAFQADCIQAIRRAGEHLDLYIMCGNRDFLMGPSLMQACRATALPDPSLLRFSGQRILLTHGDALCLADTDYQVFRKTVRSDQWQREFLAQALPERQAIARALRSQSELRKQTAAAFVDVDTSAATALLASADATLMVHGHTHQPGDHALANGRRRLVLSDWCLGAVPPRADVIRLCAPESGALRVGRLNPETMAEYPA
jgi:UDP-2,3-diacylglucosamine hydrolase